MPHAAPSTSGKTRPSAPDTDQPINGQLDHRMGRWISRKRQRLLAHRLTILVATLHGILLTTLAFAPDDLPIRIHVFELLWAAPRRPLFYPLIALLFIGPVLTLIAWQVRGHHRFYLLGAWAGSLLLLMTTFAERLGLMLEILWWRFIA